LLALLAGAAPALADSATISVTNTQGQSDPAAELPRVFTVSGSTGLAEGIMIKYRELGGPPCAPTFDTDQGSTFENYGAFDGDPDTNTTASGPYSFAQADTWANGWGTYTFCTWIATSGDTIVTPITQNITFREPTGTITATVSPTTPQPGQNFTVTVSGNSEAAQRVYASIDPAGGAGCAPTYGSDTGSGIVDGQSVNGVFNVSTTTSEDDPGNYIVCLWLASSDSDTSPIAGPQPEPFTVAAPTPPPPPCNVPSPSHASLATVEASITAAHCTVGTVGSSRSYSVPAGNVIATSPSSGQLASGAAINVTVSSGPPPCVVPKPVASLAGTEQELRASHCGVGRLVRVHSPVRRGNVVRLTPSARHVLPWDTRVEILVSAGRER